MIKAKTIGKDVQSWSGSSSELLTFEFFDGRRSKILILSVYSKQSNKMQRVDKLYSKQLVRPL